MLKKIILATLMVIGLAGCKSTTLEAMIQKQCDENRAAIQKAIPDAERRDTMLGIIDDFEFQVRSIAKDAADARTRYDVALKDYTATDAALKAIQAEMERCLARLCESSKSHSLELRKQCSAAEWETITAHYHSLKNITYL